MSALGTPNAREQSGYNIQKLLPRHFAVIEMFLGGHTSDVIAETLGMNQKTIDMLRISPLVQAELARRRQVSGEAEVMILDREAAFGKARSILDQASVKAAQTVEALLTAQNDGIRLRAADSILDRVFPKGSDGKQGNTVINITADHVNLLNQALRESNDAKQQPANEASSLDPNRGDVLQDAHPVGALAERSGEVPTINGSEGSTGNEANA